jgi:DNA adenine methylase
METGQYLAFGGKVAGRNFGMQRHGGARFDVNRLGPILEAIHERLAGVTMERLLWRTFIERYDRPGALFYLDPPYYGCETDYGKSVFGRADFEALAGVLAAVQGRFILSINDTPAMRKTFSRFAIEAVSARYSVAGKGWTDARELIISGGA